MSAQPIAIRLDEDTLEAIAEFGAAESFTKSAAIRELIRRGLNTVDLENRIIAEAAARAESRENDLYFAERMFAATLANTEILMRLSEKAGVHFDDIISMYKGMARDEFASRYE